MIGKINSRKAGQLPYVWAGWLGLPIEQLRKHLTEQIWAIRRQQSRATINGSVIIL
ncbi:hypothetical protein TK5_26440 [Sideroxyarcus sp. TK5]